MAIPLASMDPAIAAERAVLGDELIQRGDPQGELILLQLAIAALPPEAPPLRRSILERRIDALLDRHHHALYGPVLGAHTQRLSAPDVRYPAFAVTAWQAGFADAVWLQDTPNGFTIGDAHRALHGLPIARHVRRVALGRGDMTAAVAALAQAPLPSMTSLIVADTSIVSPWVASPLLNTADDLATLAPLLTELVVRNSMMVGVTLRSATLRSLELLTTPLGSSFTGELAALERLVLYGFQVRTPVFTLPTTELVLSECDFVGDALAQLLTSIDRLRVFVLRWTALTDEDLELVVGAASQLARLERVEVDGRFSPEALAAARDRLPANVRITRR